MSKQTDNEPAWAKQIAERIARLEAAGGTRVQSQLHQIEEDRVWYETKAIADLRDPGERAAKSAALDPRRRLRCVQHMTAATAIEMVDAATPAQRTAIEEVIPAGLKLDMAVERLPAPKRVRITLAPGVSGFASPKIKGARPSETYPGLRLSDGRSAEAGAAERVYVESTWLRALEIDEPLRSAVATGIVVVTEVSAEESRRLLRAEVAEVAQNRPGA